MDQHHVQKAYLKNFVVNSRLWIFNKKTGEYCRKPASQCTTEEDFQTIELEKLQNSTIERAGIQNLRKITSNDPLSEDDVSIILYWTALHVIRNENYRKNSDINYNSKFDELLETEKLFTNYFRHISTYSCSEDEFFITSDNPIIEFYLNKYILRVLTWSPKKAILFSPIDNYPKHALKFPEFVNSMLLATSFEEIYANRKDLPIKKYEENIERYNLKPGFENTTFSLKNK